MTKMCLVVVDLGGMAKRGLPWSLAVVRCGLYVPDRSEGAVAAVRGFRAHRSTGYQGISARRGWLPATLRARMRRLSATFRT
ncbi:hypothetical protein Shyhy01_65830 [Streptomyces hygroscopicus subsp. hygroscopicus]|nr:hypothetical protein Shyhy01_65830 [Streptomyces hygroscopicus subsp. hygroscopicus]